MLMARLMFLTGYDGIMAKSAGRRSKDATRLAEPGLTLVSRSSGGPDPRLVELARILARRAARLWYAEQVEARQRAQEADLPPN
jgi:hypothetical protein